MAGQMEASEEDSQVVKDEKGQGRQGKKGEMNGSANNKGIEGRVT